MFQVVCLEGGERNQPYKLAGPFEKKEDAEVALVEWKDSVYDCYEKHVIVEVE